MCVWDTKWNTFFLHTEYIFHINLDILIYNPNELIKINLNLLAKNQNQDRYAKHTLGVCFEHQLFLAIFSMTFPERLKHY